MEQIAQSQSKSDEPVTLYRVMQTVIAEKLKERYQPPEEMPHELFVLLMQMKEQERRDRQQQAMVAKKTAPVTSNAKIAALAELS